MNQRIYDCIAELVLDTCWQEYQLSGTRRLPDIYQSTIKTLERAGVEIVKPEAWDQLILTIRQNLQIRILQDRKKA